MRTTLDIDDTVLRRAKRLAVDQGKSLTAVIEDALRLHVDGLTRRATPFRLNLPFDQGELQAGVQIDDRDALYERMDGRT